MTTLALFLPSLVGFAPPPLTHLPLRAAIRPQDAFVLSASVPNRAFVALNAVPDGPVKEVATHTMSLALRQQCHGQHAPLWRFLRTPMRPLMLLVGCGTMS